MPREGRKKHGPQIQKDFLRGGEYNLGHAKGALLFPVDSITRETAAEQIPAADTPVLVYCRSGQRSRLAAEKLAALGYTQVYDVGSLAGWPYGLEW